MMILFSILFAILLLLVDEYWYFEIKNNENSADDKIGGFDKYVFQFFRTASVLSLRRARNENQMNKECVNRSYLPT